MQGDSQAVVVVPPAAQGQPQPDYSEFVHPAQVQTVGTAQGESAAGTQGGGQQATVVGQPMVVHQPVEGGGNVLYVMPQDQVAPQPTQPTFDDIARKHVAEGSCDWDGGLLFSASHSMLCAPVCLLWVAIWSWFVKPIVVTLCCVACWPSMVVGTLTMAMQTYKWQGSRYRTGPVAVFMAVVLLLIVCIIVTCSQGRIASVLFETRLLGIMIGTGILFCLLIYVIDLVLMGGWLNAVTKAQKESGKGLNLCDFV